MSYPPIGKGPAVPGRIDIRDHHEIHYWTQALGVSAEELRQLVEKYGDRADDIRINRSREKS